MPSNSLAGHLFIDVQCLQTSDVERGIPRWTKNFVRSIASLSPGSITGLFNPTLQHSEGLQSLGADIHLRPNVPASIAESPERPLAYLSMSIYEPVRPVGQLLPPHIPEFGIPVAAVMHDFVPHLFSDLYGYSALDRRLNRARESLFRTADAFLCNSRNTANDAVTCLGAQSLRTHVVGSGIDTCFHPVPQDPRRLLELRIDRKFILVVGRADPRKQTSRVIEAFAALPESLRKTYALVVACRTDVVTEAGWRATAEECGLSRNDLHITGYVSDEDLRILYSSTSLFIEPSLYEGFGFPAAEAAACGALALTSNNSSLPEVLDDREATFDPTDYGSWPALIKLALTDEAFRTARLRKNRDIADRHSWTSVAAKSIDVLNQIARI